MCIFVQNKNLKTAEEDIICYKVLKRKNLYDSTPVSPYHSEMKWDFDKLFEAPQSTLKTRYDIIRLKEKYMKMPLKSVTKIVE